MFDAKRHINIFSPATFRSPVTIVGCGGLGSRVAEGLVRMGVGENNPIHLYDNDKFEAHNVANQWVDAGGVGRGKVEAVSDAMEWINPDCRIISHPHKLTKARKLSGVVFLCVDSMAARRQIMENAIHTSPGVKCVIDIRMDAETGISHCFNPHDEQQSDCWWLYWHSDDEADNLGGCSEPQSIYSAIIGTTALALKQFEQFARTNTTCAMSNRIYMDFNTFKIRTEKWELP